MSRVTRAIEECQRDHLWSAEAVVLLTGSLAALEAMTRDGVDPASDTPSVPPIHVPRPDLSRFDLLLGGPDAERAITVFFA
jgi:hypothetical protein